MWSVTITSSGKVTDEVNENYFNFVFLFELELSFQLFRYFWIKIVCFCFSFVGVGFLMGVKKETKINIEQSELSKRRNKFRKKHYSTNFFFVCILVERNLWEILRVKECSRQVKYRKREIYIESAQVRVIENNSEIVKTNKSWY